MKDNLSLSIFTVDRKIIIDECDYITLCTAEDKKGNFSGSYGIKKGHSKAVFSLGKGKISAQDNGKTIFSAEITGGFATVENNTVSITVDSVKEK